MHVQVLTRGLVLIWLLRQASLTHAIVSLPDVLLYFSMDHPLFDMHFRSTSIMSMDTSYNLDSVQHIVCAPHLIIYMNTSFPYIIIS